MRAEVYARTCHQAIEPAIFVIFDCRGDNRAAFMIKCEQACIKEPVKIGPEDDPVTRVVRTASCAGKEMGRIQYLSNFAAADRAPQTIAFCNFATKLLLVGPGFTHRPAPDSIFIPWYRL